VERRHWTKAGWILFGIMALAAAIVVWVLRSDQEDCRDLGPVATFPQNSVTLVKCVPSFVVRGRGDDFAVYLAKAPHLAGEELKWNSRRRFFFSPAHGERFALNGEILRGPAKGPLWRCPTMIESDRLWIDAPGSEPATIRRACRRR
jgi:Rieske Fe-S protein